MGDEIVMDKSLLIRYIRSETSEQERREVIDWIDASPRNKAYFLDLKNLYVFGSMPTNKASEKEFESFVKKNNPLLPKKKAGVNIYKLISFISVPAVAVVTIILLLQQQVYNHRVEELKDEAIHISLGEIPSSFIHTIYTEKGVKGYHVLPDSSEVWINSDSRLFVPERFLGNTREVFLEGEAYFKVKPDTSCPMIVTTPKNLIVKVLGTEFNLKAYRNDDYAVTTLYKGKIDVQCGVEKEKSVMVHPKERLTFSGNVAKIETPQDPSVESAWKESRLVFDATPMSEVVKRLERWYGLEIEILDRKVLTYPITANFSTESIVEVMDMIRRCSLVDYVVQEKKIVIFSRKIIK